MTTEERENRAMTRYVIGLALIAAVAFGIVIGNYFPYLSDTDDTPPDWTVASCDMWADTDSPVLPPYTRDDVCAVQTETGAWYISSPDNPSPALTAPVTH